MHNPLHLTLDRGPHFTVQVQPRRGAFPR